MKTRRLGPNEVQLIVTWAELDILRQCLNEVCNGIGIPEFETRIGAQVADVRAMLRSLGDAVT